MICPDCKKRMKTIDTRSSEQIVYRRHECQKCKKRVTTREQIASECPGINSAMREQITLKIIKKFIYRIGWKSKLTGETYLTREEAINATIAEFERICNDEE